MLLAAALVAGRLQRRNSLEPLLAQLLLRALSLIAPPARRLYALSVVGDDLTGLFWFVRNYLNLIFNFFVFVLFLKKRC